MAKGFDPFAEGRRVMGGNETYLPSGIEGKGKKKKKRKSAKKARRGNRYGR